MEFLFATLTILAVTTIASYIYSKRIRQAQLEYDRSRNLVKSITLGFTRQLERVARAINVARSDASDAQAVASEALRASQEAIDATKGSEEVTGELVEKMKETDETIASMKEEILKLSKRPVPRVVQPSVDAAIPLRGDAVLDSLTPTEIEVLMIIEEMKECSVPEIRERIRKTREHTARLLKKLYERGFIDRNTSGMPYRYRVRKEIKELIKQQKERMKLAV